MINFETTVNCLLTEAGPAAGSNETANTNSQTANTDNSQNINDQTERPEAQKSEEQIEEEDIKNLTGYIKAHQYANIKKEFEDTFKNFYSSGVGRFPDEITFERLIYVVSKNSIRDTENVGNFHDSLPSIFPLLDLLASCKQIYTDTKGKFDVKNKAVDGVITNFFGRLKQFKTTKKQLPLEFPSVNPWASSVRARYYEKEGKLDVGKLKLEGAAELQDMSIRELVLYLIDQRNKTKIKLLTKTFPLGSAKGEINKILENPTSFIYGKINFPDKKLNLLYSGLTPDLVLSVANNSLNLFNQQKTEKEVKLDNTLYTKFLDGIVEEFKIKETQSSNKKATVTNNAEYTFFDSLNFNQAFRSILEQVTETNNDTNNPSFATGSFKLKDIRAHINTVPLAEVLFKSLKALADYIVTEVQQIDWSEKINKAASAGSQMAVGARLGAKLLGS